MADSNDDPFLEVLRDLIAEVGNGEAPTLAMGSDVKASLRFVAVLLKRSIDMDVNERQRCLTALRSSATRCGYIKDVNRILFTS